MSFTPILLPILILILILVGVIPTWPRHRAWGYALSGVFGMLLLIMVIQVLLGGI